MSELQEQWQHYTQEILTKVLRNGKGLGWIGTDAASFQERVDKGDAIMTDGGRPNQQSLEEELNRDMEMIRLIAQETRLTLVQNVLGHPWMMPSLQEFNDYNPKWSKGTISGHLDKLVDGGVFMRVYVPQGKQQRDLPSTYYTLTDQGFELLERHRLLLPHLEEIRDDHARVEKTDTLARLKDAPRPTVNVSYDHPLKGDGRSIVEPGTNESDEKKRRDMAAK